MLPLLVVVVCAVLAVLPSTLASPHFTSFYTQTFPWNNATTIQSLNVSKLSTTTVGVSSNVLSLSPFQSIFAKNVTVDAVANLAFPFTGPTGGYQDVDTGIDVLAGGIVTFYIPLGYTGGYWCYELGRAGAGNQYCSGPPGAWYSGTDPTVPAYLYNAKINGAYVSTDPAVPAYVDTANPALGFNSHSIYVYNSSTLVNGTTPAQTLWNQTQYGTNRGFTWTRSGSIVFRIGAYGASGSSSAYNYNFNDPTTDYDSAFDSTAENKHPAPTVDPTVGLVGRSIVTPISGRLFVACWRWNLWPTLNYGQVWTLINYTSPVQVAASWTPAATTAFGGYANPALLTQQPIPSVVPLPDTFASNVATTAVNASLRAQLPVDNITISAFSPAASASQPLIQSSFSYHYPNVRNVPATQFATTSPGCCYGGTSVNVNWSTSTLQQYDGMFGTLLSYNNSLAWDMTHILDANSTSPFFPASGTFLVNTIYNLWYPQSQLGSYVADVDTGINVLEGGTITLTAPIQTWCMATYRYNATQLCSDARGATSFGYYGTTQNYLIGCDIFYWIFRNSTVYNQASYDNSGCNSGSMAEPPNGALLVRVGSNNQGHSPIDYATAFTDRTQTGQLTATYRVPASGRLYFAAAAMWNGNVLTANSATFQVTQNGNAGLGQPYSGQQQVSVVYTPPTELSFGFSWSPTSATYPGPMSARVPASLAVADLTSAGYTLVPASSSASTGLGAGVVTGQYIYYVLPQPIDTTKTYTSTWYAYMDLAEADSVVTSQVPTSTPAASTAAGTAVTAAGTTVTAAPTAAGTGSQPTAGPTSTPVTPAASTAGPSTPTGAAPAGAVVSVFTVVAVVISALVAL